MSYMPVALNLDRRKVVVIGGGKIALHKVNTLLRYGAAVHVYGREVSSTIRALPVTWVETPYTPTQLEGAVVVYGATDDRALNREIGADARKLGALVNVVDDPKNCDFVSPALHQDGIMSVAVTSNGQDVMASIALRDRIRALLLHEGES